MMRSEPSICPHCTTPAAQRLAASTVPIAEMLTALDAAARQVRGLTVALQAARAEIKRARTLVEAEGRHPRCATCTALCGPGHPISELVIERHGSELVCRECRARLDEAGITAAEWIRRELVSDQRERMGDVA